MRQCALPHGARTPLHWPGTTTQFKMSPLNRYNNDDEEFFSLSPARLASSFRFLLLRCTLVDGHTTILQSLRLRYKTPRAIIRSQRNRFNVADAGANAVFFAQWVMYCFRIKSPCDTYVSLRGFNAKALWLRLALYDSCPSTRPCWRSWGLHRTSPTKKPAVHPTSKNFPSRGTAGVAQTAQTTPGRLTASPGTL